MDDRGGARRHRFRAAAVKRHLVIAAGGPGHLQSVDLAGAEVVVHVERAVARQLTHRQGVELPRLAKLDAAAIQGQLRDLAISDHYPAGIAVDRQIGDVGQLPGQGCGILQRDVRRGPGVGNDITLQMTVIDRHAGHRYAFDLQKGPVTTHQGGTITHLDRGVYRR
ncbi:hypothetical protein D3C84_662960 [compost metagenome]